MNIASSTHQTPPHGGVLSLAEGAASAGPGGGPRLIVAVLAATGIAVAVMQTLVIPIVGQLPVLLSTSAANATWALTATLLTAAVATPIAGRLGDMLGKRPMLLVTLALMVVGSVVCALSNSLVPMVTGRALQGAAMGAIPLGISLMRDLLPADRVAPATATMSASLGVGASSGLPAAALIAENTSWHVLFWVSAGLGALVFVSVALVIRPPSPRAGGRFDVLGAAGLSLALVALLLAVSQGQSWGWTAPLTVVLLAGSGVLMLAWVAWELHTPQPLVDLRTATRRQVLLTNTASVTLGFAMFASTLVIPQLIQLPVATGHGLGRSMLVAGLAMVPSGLAMMVAAPWSARVSRLHGAKASLMLGAGIVALGYALGLAMMDAVWQLAVVSGVLGVGIGFAYGAMPTLIMAAVSVEATASANSVNTLLRSIGTSVSSAVAGAVLASSATLAGGISVPTESGFRIVLAVAGGVAVLGLIAAAMLPAPARASDGRAAD